MEPNSYDPHSANAPEFPCASVIVFANGDETDTQIWETARSLGRVLWRTQVLIVDPATTGEQLPSVRVSYRPMPPVFRSVASAIRAARHETILIVDPQLKVSSNDWSWLASRFCGSKIQCYLQKYKHAQRRKNILLSIYLLIVQLLFKTRKTEFTPGLVLLPKQSIQPIARWVPAAEQPENPVLEVTQLLAFARLYGHPIEEVEFFERSAGDQPIHSKSLAASGRNVIRFWWNKIMFPLARVNDRTVQHKPAIPWQLASWATLMVATVAILFTNLGFPLFEPDEARNAQLAINIVESGDWLSLTLAGEPYWDKPPLQIWSIAACYKAFGISPLTTRLPSAVAAALTILFTIAIGRKLVGFQAAMIGAFLLLLSCGFLLIGRYVTMDASLTCWTTLMMLSLFQAVTRSKKNWLVVAGVGAGIGLLVKGPVILVLGLPPVAVAVFLQSHLPTFKPKHWLLFVLPAFLIAAPWFLATSIVHPDFLVYFFWKHHVVRFSDAFNHREPFWYYVPMLLIMMFPASFLFPSLVKFATSKAEPNRLLRTPEHGFLMLTALWIVGFFSISESKLPTYILPALPAVCLLMGVLLNKKIFSARVSGWQSLSASQFQKPSFLETTPRRSLIQLSILTAVLICLAPLLLDVSLRAVAIAVLVALALAILMVAVLKQKSSAQTTAWYGWAAISMGFVLFGSHFLMPAISNSRSIHTAAKYLRSEGEMIDAPIVFFGRENYGASMTLPTEDVHYFDAAAPDEVCEFLAGHPRALIIAGKDEMKNLRRMLSWKIKLEKSESGARHLYVSRPNPTVITAHADDADESLQR